MDFSQMSTSDCLALAGFRHEAIKNSTGKRRIVAYRSNALVGFMDCFEAHRFAVAFIRLSQRA